MNIVAELSGVTYRYGKVTAVDGLNLAIPSGGVYALLGANGAGKTTTISMLLGLFAPSEGAISVLGLRPGQMKARQPH